MMARINIEDSIFRDHRFISLVQSEGSYWAALGLIVGAWMLAQKYYLDTSNDRLIPLNEWDRSLFGKLESIGLAERKQKGVYVKGSDEQFSWLVQRSNAGKKSAHSRKKPNDRATDVQRNSTVEQPLTLTPTLTPTPTLTQSRTRSIIPANRQDEKLLNKKIWESYFNAYRLRYGVDPVRNATINTQISNLRKRLGEEACKVVEFYLSHNDSFYLKSTHSVGLCLRDCESLRTQMLRGTAITSTMVKSFEKRNKSAETLAELDKLWSDDNVE